MNFLQFQSHLQQFNSFAQQLQTQFPDGNIPALDKDVLCARLRFLYELLLSNPVAAQFTTHINNAEPLIETKPVLIKTHPETVENIIETVENNPVLIKTRPETVENIIETVENNPVLIDTKPETVENNPAQEVEFIIETPQIVQKPEIVTAPTLEIVNTAADTQNNTLTIINNPPQNDIPRNDTTGLVVNSVFSMVEQKNNAVTINNRAIYDANEEALRNQSAFKSEYDELFEFKAAAELSQRLSETKINDLNKSMGLNEKFFYINELFGGNSAKFRTCIEFLNNNAKNMEMAREYLETEIMDAHSWANPKRKPLAKDFIKTVRRRYLK